MRNHLHALTLSLIVDNQTIDDFESDNRWAMKCSENAWARV